MGFWSTLAKIGSTALGVAGTVIPGLSGASTALKLISGIGGGIGSAVLGGLGDKAASGNTTTAGTSAGNSFLDPLIASQMEKVKAQNINARPAIQQGLDTMAPAKDYFSKALGGDRQALSDLLAPEVSTVLSQYDNAAKTAAEFAPRGGGRTAALADAGFKKAGAYGTALAGLRTGAATNLAGIGEKEAQLGLQGEGLEATERGQDIGLLSSLLGNKFSSETAKGSQDIQKALLDFQKSQASNAQYAGLGKDIGSLLINILNKNKTGKAA